MIEKHIRNMKEIIKKLLVICGVLASVSVATAFTGSTPAYADDYAFSGNCREGFLGLYSWDCNVNISDDASLKSGIWMIATNVAVDIAVIATYLIIGYVIYGGYLYTFSGGDPNKVATGKKTLTQAFIGLAITMCASIIMGAIRIALVGGTGDMSNCVSASCVKPDEMVANLVGWVTGIAGIVSAVFLVYGAIQYVTSAGDPGKLKKAKERAHILEGLKIALDNIDEVIKVIRASYDDADKQLMQKFGLSEIQANAILQMQLRRLQGLERDKIEEELKQLHELIKKLEAILADEREILRVIKEELLALKDKYGDERRSKIINHEVGKFSEEELIPEEESVILLTSENYMKRVPQTDFRKQNRGGKGKRGMTTKEEDVIAQILTANSHDFLLFFTNQGRLFRMKAYEVPQASLAAKGTAAVNMLNMHPEEKITAIIKQGDAGADGYLFMATKKGTIKKSAIKDSKISLMLGAMA